MGMNSDYLKIKKYFFQEYFTQIFDKNWVITYYKMYIYICLHFLLICSNFQKYHDLDRFFFSRSSILDSKLILEIEKCLEELFLLIINLYKSNGNYW